MAEESIPSGRPRPPFVKHFVLITLYAAVAYAAMAVAFGQQLPSSAANRFSFFIGAGLGTALISLLVFYVTWKGGIGRTPRGAAWGAASLLLFFVLLDHLSDAKLLP